MTDTDPPPGLVAVPAVPWMLTRAATAFLRLAVNLPDGSDLRFLRGGTTIAAKRNEAAHKVVANKRWTWLLQVDSDMTPPLTPRNASGGRWRRRGAMGPRRLSPTPPVAVASGTWSRP